MVITVAALGKVIIDYVIPVRYIYIFLRSGFYSRSVKIKVAKKLTFTTHIICISVIVISFNVEN